MPVSSFQSNRIHSSFLTPANVEDIEVTQEEEVDPQISTIYQYKSDVKLDPRIFREACTRLKFQPDIDLFASDRHHQLDRYCSMNKDSKAYCCDAFSVSWFKFRPYINPPWELIDRVLEKVIAEKVTCLMLIPLWRHCSWFDVFDRITVRNCIYDKPLYLDERNRLRPKPSWSSCFAVIDGGRARQN